MIDKNTLTQINAKVEAKQRIEEILRGFESPYVETTIGLVEINSASKHEAKNSEDATWFHWRLPEIEKELKTRAAALLRGEIAKIDAWLSERVVS